MRAENTRSHPRKTPQAIGAVIGIFAVGLACGWFVKALLVGEQESTSDAFVGIASERRVTSLGGDAAHSSSEPADEFVSRLHNALGIRSQSKRERALSAVADELDAAQVREALAQLDKMRITQREQARAQLLARWGELDPAASIEHALARPHAAQVRDAVKAVVNGWVENDANAAAKWVAELPDGALKAAAFETLIKAVAATDPQHAFALVQDAPSSLNAQGMSRDWTPIVRAVFAKWAENDPRAAAAAAAQLNNSFRDTALYLVAARWASADIDSALAWARSQPNDRAKQRLRESTFVKNAVTGVMETWIHQDPDAAMMWLEGLPDGNEKANLTQCTFFLTYQQDPARAMELALMIPQGTAQESALRFAVRSWADTDPAGAFTWATQQPDEQVRRTTLKLVATQWLNADPQGARQWIASLPASPEKDGMLSDAVRLILEGETVGRSTQGPSIDRMAGDGYREVAQMIANIGDAQQKQAASEKLAAMWLRKKPEAACAWLESSTLPRDVKDRLLNAKGSEQTKP